MTEDCYNLFLFVDENEIIYEVGIVTHRLSGSDEEKIAALSAAVNDDYRNCRLFPLPEQLTVVRPDGEKVARRLSYPTFVDPKFQATGYDRLVLEPALQAVGAPEQPLRVVTPIVNGKPRIDRIIHHNEVQSP